MSILLFALFLEPLAQNIRQNGKIEGIRVYGVEHKTALYADEVLLYLKKPKIPLPKIMTSKISLSIFIHLQYKVDFLIKSLFKKNTYVRKYFLALLVL